MKSILDVRYGKTEQCLDIHLPECDEFPVMVYFHGGGIESGDKANTKNFLHFLPQNGMAVVSVNYRMYPNAKYPDFLEDAAEAVAWVFNNMSNYGKIKGVFVGGSSAGGYISQMLCFDNRWLGAHGIDPVSVTGYIHDAGQPTCHFNVLRERGINKNRVIIDDSAPLFHVGVAENYSPMLVIVSDNDMKNRYEQTMLLISTLDHFGHKDKVTLKIMNGTHCAYCNQLDESGISVLGKIVVDYIKSVLN